jgi:site-specific recombinase XerD
MQGPDLQQLADMVAERMQALTAPAHLRSKRKPERVPDYLTEEEIGRLLGAINNIRDKAIFVVAYHRGLRASELGMIDVNDYHAASGRLTIRRLKGSRGGEYYVTEAERYALADWLEKRGTVPGRLFISRNRQGISRFRLHRLMRQYCTAAGIPRQKAHMHALKHSCATHLSAIELDVVAIQDHLGHKNIQNTMKYIQISGRRRKQFADRLERQGWGSKAAGATLQ